jgi:hypothetical protein
MPNALACSPSFFGDPFPSKGATPSGCGNDLALR